MLYLHISKTFWFWRSPKSSIFEKFILSLSLFLLLSVSVSAVLSGDISVGQNDTYILSPSYNTYYGIQNGTDVWFNKVGIGTTSPDTNLEVAGDTATLRISDSSANRLPQLEFLRGTGAFGSDTYADWRILDVAGNLKFYVDGTAETTATGNHLTLMHTGLVGIGTENPDTTLHIVGDSGLKISESTETYNSYLVAKSPGMEIQNGGGNEIMVFDNTNLRVGIGTTAPANPLDVYADNSAGHIASFDQDNSGGYGVLINVDGTGTNSALLITDASDNQLFRVQQDGTTEIGVNNGYLQITGTDENKQRARLGDSSAGGGYVVLYNDAEASTALIRSYLGGTAGKTQAYFTAGGIGIGTDNVQYGLLEVKPTANDAATGITIWTGTGSTCRSWIDSGDDWQMSRGATAENGLVIETDGDLRTGSDMYVNGGDLYVQDATAPELKFDIGSTTVGQIQYLSGINYYVGGVSSTNKVASLSAGGMQIGGGQAGVDYTLSFNGDDNNGYITWYATQDYFTIADKLIVGATLQATNIVDFSSANDLTMQTGLNTPCTTTCGNDMCYIGYNDALDTMVDCSDATADKCICSN